MNWESSILNRIYRTNDFKISFININNLKDKGSYIMKIKEILELYKLDKYKIVLNSNGALLKNKPNNNTFYFSFNLNTYFYLYSTIFTIESKHVNYANFCDAYFISERGEYDKENNLQGNDLEQKGKDYSYCIKCFIFKFLFTNEYEDSIDDISLAEYYEKFDKFFRYRNFLIGNEITHYDIILYSILFLYKENTSKFIDLFIPFDLFMKKEEKENILYKYFQRWVFAIRNFSLIDFEKIDKCRQSHYKEYLFETFKLISNHELVELVMQLDKHENESNNKLEKLKSANIIKFESLKCRNKQQNNFENSNLIKENFNNRNNDINSLDVDAYLTLNSNKYSNEEVNQNVINICDSNTPLKKNHFSSFEDEEKESEIYEKIRLLLLSGENVNSRELQTYKTLSHLACRKRNLRLLKLLIEFDADLEAIDFEYMTPIFEAVITGDFSICKFLIDEMKINLEHKEIQNRTAFYWTACNGDVEMIQYLIKKGVDVNITSKMGRTPLSKAAWNGKRDVVEMLVKFPNIEINKPDKNGRYPIHNAVWGVNGGRLGKKVTGLTATDNPECAKLLIDHGALIEVQDKEGYTPLMIAASTNGVDSLLYLLEKNGKVNTKNKYGATALIECSRYGNWECVKVLLENSNDLDIHTKDNFGMSAIDYTILLNRIEALDLLLQKQTFIIEEYYNIIIMSLFSRKIITFEFIIKFLKEKKILEKFSLENLYTISEKAIIIHQYDKFLKLFSSLKEIEENLLFDFKILENNLDLLILGVLSLKIYEANKEKTILSSSREFSLLSRSHDENGERDYDDIEDEIREKILNNLKNNENLYNNPDTKIGNSNMNEKDLLKNKCNYGNSNAIHFMKLHNFSTCLNSDNFNKDDNVSSENDRSLNLNNETEKILKFEEYLDNVTKVLIENTFLGLIDFKKTMEDKFVEEIHKEKNVINFNMDNALFKDCLSQKFIKLLIYLKAYEALKSLFNTLSDIANLLSLNIDNLIKESILNEEIENEKDTNSENTIIDSFDRIFNIAKFNEFTKDTRIRAFICSISFNSKLNIPYENFSYIYSLNKRKKEDNYYENWKRHLNNFNNNNALSFCLKNIFKQENSNNENEKSILMNLLNTKILSILIFCRLENKKNIFHLIFPKSNTFEILDIILKDIKKNFPNNLKKIISMLNSTDNKNLTPIDIAIKKKNYDMVEIYTKIINDFLIESEFDNRDNDITEEIKSFKLFKNFIDLNDYKENILYKIINYKIRDDCTIVIPEDYKSYLRDYCLILEDNIKFVNEGINSLTCDASQQNFSGGGYNEQIRDFSVKEKKNKKIDELINVEEILFKNISFGENHTIKYILNRNDVIIKEINSNKMISNFNFNLRRNQISSIAADDIKSTNFYWVNSIEKLKQCKEHLNQVKYFGVDLEFHNYKANSTNFGIVCVIQLSSIEKTFAIDSLILDQNSIREEIKSLFEDEKILKIFHGCDNDLNYLISNYQIFTKNFIDTGRTYLAFQKMILNKSFKVAHLPSLSYLSKIILNYEIDKSYQKADWRIRPLTKNMLSYALSDAKIVIYIFEVYIGLYNYLNESILEKSNKNLNVENNVDDAIHDYKKTFYQDLIQKLRDNKLKEKEIKSLKDNSIAERKNNVHFHTLLLESILRSLEIIKHKINFEYKKIEIELNV